MLTTTDLAGHIRRANGESHRATVDRIHNVAADLGLTPAIHDTVGTDEAWYDDDADEIASTITR